MTTLYLADLDAIAGSAPAISLYESLHAEGFFLWVDAGLHGPGDAEPLRSAGVARVIAGLETLSGPEELGDIVRTCSPDRVVFSLDLKAGSPIASPKWASREPLAIVERAIETGVRSVLALDLARVGIGAGVGTEDLCRAMRGRWPFLEIIAGGGVRGPDDIQRLTEVGVDHILVASALHDGRLIPDSAVLPPTLIP